MSELCRQFCPAYQECTNEFQAVQRLQTSYEQQMDRLMKAALDVEITEAGMELAVADIDRTQWPSKTGIRMSYQQALSYPERIVCGSGQSRKVSSHMLRLSSDPIQD